MKKKMVCDTIFITFRVQKYISSVFMWDISLDNEKDNDLSMYNSGVTMWPDGNILLQRTSE